MPKRYRALVLTGVVFAASVLALSGCSSSGGSKPVTPATTTASSAPATPATPAPATTDTGDPATSAPATDPATTSDSPTADPTTSDSSGDLFADAGCNQAYAAMQNVSKVSGTTDPKQALAALNTMVSQLRDAASKSKNPAAAAAINKLADDFQTIISAVESGKSSTPDFTSVMNDGKAMALACQS